ncbi:restriction endonuclease subunit S [Candidatus Venteria ishoeyi]|uniref:Type I restriction modification DNA specificity domain protein n=1 Tax=Candidatus Venteria ishoeyi TaxID=1899563 RepID=A0A1H6FEP0_9GAMM|nr:restriction endonuclease subunit S [Candidatus Venteria ishoeyi]SEH08123.1 Type I restriction modification DNA specificity domain protein [Candidatus Venteria ishoeyi]
MKKISVLHFKLDNGKMFPEWGEYEFNEIAKRIPDKFNPLISDEIPLLVEMENIESKTCRLININPLKNEKSIKTAFQEKDVLFGKLRPYLRKFAYTTFSGVCSSEIWVIRGKLVSNGFLYFLIQTNRFIQIANKSSGSKMPRADWSVIGSSIFKIPQPEEQQKIAAFLSVADKKLSALRRKHELLQSYKRGVMQKIFSQQLRFKADDGTAFPEWEEKMLSNILTPEIREIDKPTKNYLAIGIRSHMKGTFQKPDSDPNAIAMDKLYKVQEEDLIVNITFAWEGAIAIVKAEDNGGLVSHRFPTYRIKPTQSTPSYFQHIIMDKRFKYMLDLISPGGAGRNRVLSKKEFLKLKWSFPCLVEQQKIATFLTAIDHKITAVATQTDKMEAFKKGLLQQMFI